jgi:glucokinase
MIFAVDGGGTTFKTAVVDEAGAISARESFELPAELTVRSLRELLNGIYQRRRTECEEAGSPLKAIGIGCRGIIDSEGLRLLDDTGVLKFFAGGSFRELIESELPMGAENDAVAAAMGEARFGIGKQVRDFVLLTLGTGIGGGIVIGGRVYKGHTGMAGHLGHFPVNPEGVRCGCGNLGCVETEFSATAFDRKIGELNAARGGAEPIRGTRELFDRAEGGDEEAVELLRGAVFFLARAISGYANALDPERLVLSGGIARAGDFLMEMLVESLEPVLWRKSAREFVVYSDLGAEMGLYGAGAVGAAVLESRGSG